MKMKIWKETLKTLKHKNIVYNTSRYVFHQKKKKERKIISSVKSTISI